jgi:hypothetical protein
MTQHTTPQVRLPLRSTRLVWAICLFLVAVIIATTAVILIANSDNGSASSPAPTTQSLGGPNEAARGQAAATSAGAVSGGPNETLRGQAGHAGP